MVATTRIPVADGVELAADSFGDPGGRPVVLLHGGGQTRHAWHNTAAQLGAAGWHALSVDLRGHGDSDWSPDGDYRFERFSADVTALARQLDRSPALVGASLGGIASLLAIGESPEPLATALVLVDVAPHIEPAGVERIRAFMRQGLDGFADLEAAADAIATYNPHRPRPRDLSGLTKNLRQRDDGRWYWHWDPRFMAPDDPADRDGRGGIDGIPPARYVTQQRLEAAARNLTVPTLLVRGRSSDLLSEEGAREMLELVPQARMVDVAGAGHMVAGDRNDRFNTAVIEFLGDV
ncbi:MAG: alpha/beta hydrolase [Acidimicrobiia bacterium]|nr:alpha/beta hydrolase [Acidimicrobiia bacterium]